MIDYISVFVNGLLGAAAAAVIASAVAFIKYLARRSKEAAYISKAEWNAISLAVKASIHDQLHRCCRCLADEGGLTEDEVENLGHLFKGYKAMGLNGTGEKLYNQIMKKPIKYED